MKVFKTVFSDSSLEKNICLVFSRVTNRVRRSTSVDSDLDRVSVISTDTAIFTDRTAIFSTGRIESWVDLLWPQPKFVKIDSRYFCVFSFFFFSEPDWTKLFIFFYFFSVIVQFHFQRTIAWKSILMVQVQVNRVC